jgi:hydrophobic/amphiphilic exporter-1 (mainly G- bacteria), HAE1 family
MNVSESFIRRPIATSLLMAAIALFGVVAYRSLPISDLPTVANATINVSANLPCGDPATMAASVASPLERRFTTIAGVDEMTSSSGTGSSNITLTFDPARDIDSAAVDVQTAIAAALPLLPSTLTSPPSFRKVNLADEPIFDVNLTSDTVEMSKLDAYAEDLLVPRISMVNGVSQVNIQGAAKYAVRVQVNPEKLQAQHIGINDINTALQNWNVNQPTGQLFGPQATYNIQAKGQLNNADEFRGIVVSYRNGRPVRLEQVATVIDSLQTTTQRA